MNPKEKQSNMMKMEGKGGGGSFLDFKTRITKFVGYMESIDASKLKDLETTVNMLNSFCKSLDKFRDVAKDSRAVLFTNNLKDFKKSGNITWMDNKTLRVNQNPPKGGNYTMIYENGGFEVYRGNKLSIDKKK